MYIRQGRFGVLYTQPYTAVHTCKRKTIIFLTTREQEKKNKKKKIEDYRIGWFAGVLKMGKQISAVIAR